MIVGRWSFEFVLCIRIQELQRWEERYYDMGERESGMKRKTK